MSVRAPIAAAWYDGAVRLRGEHLESIEQFLYDEAALLDARRYDEWFALLSPRIRYRAPIRTTRTVRESAGEWSGSADMAHFDEDHASLAMRLRRLETGRAWAEDPPSRTRHLITNVRAWQRSPGEALVESCFILTRARGERSIDTFTGVRNDVLETSASAWLIAERTVRLDQTTILAANLSFFF